MADTQVKDSKFVEELKEGKNPNTPAAEQAVKATNHESAPRISHDSGPVVAEVSQQTQTTQAAELATVEEPAHTVSSEPSTHTTQTEQPHLEKGAETRTQETRDTNESIQTEKEEAHSLPEYIANEKKSPTANVHPVDADRDVSAEEEGSQIRWVTGVRAQFPWLGASSIFAVLVCMGFATAILVCSNGQRVSVWPTTRYPVRPNVLLNLVNSLSNLCLLTAITQGMAIAWWRKAMRGGTIESLFRNHTYSTSFMSVLLSGKHFNTIALAALMAKFTIIDSTLFQQATKTKVDYQTNYMVAPVKAWIQPSWPIGVGGVPGTDGETRALSSNFTGMIDAFNTMIGNGKIHDNAVLFTGCPNSQTCSGELNAVGFDFNCSLSIEDVDYGAWRMQNLTAPPNRSGVFPLYQVDFKTIWGTAARPWASINMTVVHINSTEGPQGSCPGTLATRICEITPAVVRYPVQVLASTPQQAMNVTHIAFSNSTAISYPFNAPLDDHQIDTLAVESITRLNESAYNISTVGAITFALNNLFKGSANLSWSNDWDLSVSGSRAQVEFPAEDTDDIANHCAYTMDNAQEGHVDPFIELVREINNFAFIGAMYLSGAPYTAKEFRDSVGYPHMNFTTNVKGYVEIYTTNKSFLAGALVAVLFTIALVLPVYWQFWKIGRKVTLDPFEIANALSAPIFDQAEKKNGEVEELIDEVGKRHVKYGVLVDAHNRLGMAEPEKVGKPKRVKGSKADFAVKAGAAGVVGGVVTALTCGIIDPAAI